MNGTLNILHLEDNDLDAELVANVVAGEGLQCSIHRVQDRAGFLSALENAPDIILADFSLPGFSGADALQIARDRTPGTPFILVSGALGEELAIEMIKKGMTDYVMKHRLSRLAPAIQRALREAEEIQTRQRAEKEREEANRELERAFMHTYELAFVDQLTGIPNREALLQNIELLITQGENPFHVLLLNLDGFRRINYRTRYEIGDSVLIAIADRVRKALPDEIRFGRLAGDSFLTIVRQGSHAPEAIADAILSALQQPVVVQEHEFLQSGTVSIVRYPDDGRNGGGLLKTAELNLREARRTGGRVRRFTPEDRLNLERRLAIENALLQRDVVNEMYLVFQPKGRIRDGAVPSLEALIRWKSPKFGELSPAHFIPLAEEIGAITSMSEWIIETGLQTLERMDAMGYPPVHLAINLSPIHLKRPDFLSDLFELFSRHSIAPGRIEFEITEGLLLEDSEWTAGMLTELRNAGFRLALDDFGTGFSNLGYLSRFPVDTIKIDRSFISEIHINERNRSIVRAMISLAEAMGSETVAEGVELEEEFQALADLGCHLIQGYFFSRPLKTEDLFNFLQNRSPVP